MDEGFLLILFLMFLFLASIQAAVRLNQRDSLYSQSSPGTLLSFTPLPQGRMEPQSSQGPLGAEGDCGILSLLLPSPQSEAMTHEMEELSLQPTQSLPPLNERKNGKDVDVLLIWLSLCFCLHLSFSHSSQSSAWLRNSGM